MAFAVEIFETLAELGFVIQLLVFTYTLFWLYLTFRDMQLLFGVSAAVSGYMIFVHGVSMTLLISFFVFMVLFGMQIQQLAWFGLFPLLGYHIMGDRLSHVSEIDPLRMQQRMQNITEKIEAGTVSPSDMEFLEKHMGQQQMGGAGMNPDMEQIRRMQMMGVS
ncbi:hypothetical protein HZC09_00380 [Candidatus Micrarchaeota archaeon]|nr:hypothetical protein [Candidatus Micrarchaeota archaeon]